MQAIDTEHFFFKIFRLPRIGIGFGRNVESNYVMVDFLAHGGDGVRYVLHFHQFNALFVDDLALVVHHIVIFEQVFTDFIVTLLYFLLCPFDGARHPRMENGLIFLHAEFLQQPVNAFGTENTHEVVFKRQEEF